MCTQLSSQASSCFSTQSLICRRRRDSDTKFACACATLCTTLHSSSFVTSCCMHSCKHSNTHLNALLLLIHRECDTRARLYIHTSDSRLLVSCMISYRVLQHVYTCQRLFHIFQAPQQVWHPYRTGVTQKGCFHNDKCMPSLCLRKVS